MNRKFLALGASAAVLAAALATSAPSGTASAASRSAREAQVVQTDPANQGALPDATFGPTQRASAIASFQQSAPAVATALHLTKGSNLKVKDVVRDTDGVEHVRYTRTYQGLPVVGGDFVVHNAAKSPSADVTWDQAGNFGPVDTKATVSKAAALTAAGAPAGATAEEVIWAVDGKPRLAWRTTAPASDGLHKVVVINASTGAQIQSYDLEQTSDASGTGKTLYSGNVTIRTDQTGSTYTMRDLTRGGHYVTSMGNTTSTESSPLTQSTNVWGDNTESNANTVAADAQYGAAKTWDFYKGLGRNGIRNDGTGARSRVHYGSNYDNAFWSDDCFCMSYGDGNQFTPLVPLDVAGHEMSHGVTSNTAGLLYFGESGGLNEGTSDIFGTSVEFYANDASDPGDYYIGEKIASGFPGGALRRMDHPSLDGSSYDCDTPLMGRSDVHYTSGVANHFFYLISEGSGAKVIGGLQHDSPTCDGSTITGIGRTAADRIWYRALTVYMVPGTDYKNARDATIRAAMDIFGTSSGNCSKVVKAWNAVSVPSGEYKCTGPITSPTGADAVSNGGFESGSTGWTQASSGGTAIISQSGTARTGLTNAYLRGYGATGTDTLRQTVTVPSVGTPKLVYWLLIDSAETGSTAFDKFLVQVAQNGQTTTLQTSNNAQWDDSYHRRIIDLSAYKGQQINLRFVGTEDNTLPTGFLVDDVSILSY